jgi:heme/copper-type cytochrome/quinol oxidase subunit 3
MKARAVIDVAQVPESVLDHRSTIWWGNLLLLFIETTMFALLVAGYFYVRPNFSSWPPPQVNGPVEILDPVPELRVANLNLVVIVLSCAPMLLADRAALKHRVNLARIGLILTILFGGVAIWLRWHEFHGLRFRWDDNAYASIVWTLLGMHLLHLVVGTCENIVITTWILVKGMDDKHARDLRVGAMYWYWIALIWLPLYAIVFLGPRFF